MLKVLKSDSAAPKSSFVATEKKAKKKKANTFAVSQALSIQTGAAASPLSAGARLMAAATWHGETTLLPESQPQDQLVECVGKKQPPPPPTQSLLQRQSHWRCLWVPFFFSCFN